MSASRALSATRLCTLPLPLFDNANSGKPLELYGVKYIYLTLLSPKSNIFASASKTLGVLKRIAIA